MITAIAITAWLQLSTPAKGSGVGIAALVCDSLDAAATFSNRLKTGQSPAPTDPLDDGSALPCVMTSQMPMTAEVAARYPVVIGPFKDWQNDVWTVHRIERGDKVFFGFTYWPNGYKPIGHRI